MLPSNLLGRVGLQLALSVVKIVGKTNQRIITIIITIIIIVITIIIVIIIIVIVVIIVIIIS